MTPKRPANFDRLARVYRALEFVAFGRDLERVRFCFVDRLRECRHVLLLGEGDGRFLARLLPTAPHARVHCVDASAGMLAAAAARIAPDDRRRVTFTQADVLGFTPEAASYDAVTTLFLLDCFTDDQLPTLVPQIARGLTPDAYWLFGDFVLPRRPVERLRARVWLRILYTFFRWQTGLATRQLPHSETAIERAGYVALDSHTLQHGLLRTTVYRRSPGLRSGRTAPGTP